MNPIRFALIVTLFYGSVSQAKLSISSVSPSSGPIEGGTTVLIKGHGFQVNTNVSFGGINASAVTFLNPSRLSAISPAHAAGMVALAVELPTGGRAQKEGAFMYLSSTALTVDAGADRTADEGTPSTFSATIQGGVPPYVYMWDFGDGSTSNSERPSHAYADNGSYVVSLRIIDSSGKTGSDSLSVTVNSIAPIVTAGGPYAGLVGSEVSFVGNATDPSSADTLAGFVYDWNFGDGSVATGQSPVHLFQNEGTYSIRLRVTDKDGAVGVGSSTAVITKQSSICTDRGLLVDALSITEISTSEPVNQFHQIRGLPHPSGGTVVAWSVESPYHKNDNARLTWLDENNQRIRPDTVLPLDQFEGFTATPDGYALLTVGQNADGFNIIKLVRVNHFGDIVVNKTLLGGCDLNTVGCIIPQDYQATGELLWIGDKFAAYFPIAKNFGGSVPVHQGDMLLYLDANGNRLPGGWDWGCSHSRNQGLAFNGTRMGAFCIREAYPSFSIKYNLSSVIESVVWPYYINGLGATLPTLDGFLVMSSMIVPNQPYTGVYLTRISNSGAVVDRKTIRVRAEGKTGGGHLAPFEDGYLSGWVEGSNQWERWYLARLDSSGQLAGTPELITARFSPDYGGINGPTDAFFSYTNGDVGWANKRPVSPWQPVPNFHLMRVKKCQ